MRFDKVDSYRETDGIFKTNSGDNYGKFWIPHPSIKQRLQVIAAPSDSEWQHVSVSLPSRCPTWEEMCFIKGLFWDEHEVVVQFHPAKDQYVNNHPFCLHLWRHNKVEMPTPPSILVGIKGLK